MCCFPPFNITGLANENFNTIHSQSIQVEDWNLKTEPKRTSYIYLTWLCSLMVHKLKTKQIHIFNIGSGESYSVGQIAAKIVELTGKSVKISYTGERRKNEIMNTIADLTRVKKVLGWEPLVDINQGLLKILDKTY